MATKKVLITFGTRPEAIKMAPVVRAFDADDRFDCRLCVTSQHREMLDQVLRVFDLQPHHDLDVMTPGQDLFDVTSKVLLGMRDVLGEEQPDLLIVQGDTSTTFASALAAFYLKVPVGHVEAGLRSGNLLSPFPEEGNRIITGHLTAVHFCPTVVARDNLLREGTPKESVFVTGNTVIDALLEVKDRALKMDPAQWRDVFGSAYEAITGDGRLVLITAHRRESFGEGFKNICAAIAELSARHADVEFVYPAHFNPNVRGPVFEALSGKPNIHLIDPLEYLPFVYLMNRSEIILTDSGGIQEEAPSLGKPVLVMRDTTERVEAIEAGTALLVGTQSSRIIAEGDRLLSSAAARNEMGRIQNPYGDGKAALNIVDAASQFLG